MPWAGLRVAGTSMELADGCGRSLAALLRALALEGAPVFVDVGGSLRVFIPARDVLAGELPPLDRETVLWRGMGGVAGVSLPSAGAEVKVPVPGVRDVTWSDAAHHLATALRDLDGGLARVSLEGTRIRVAGLAGGVAPASFAAGFVARLVSEPVQARNLLSPEADLELEPLPSAPLKMRGDAPEAL